MNGFFTKWLLLYPVHFFRNEPISMLQKQFARLEKMSRKELDIYQDNQLAQIIKLGMKQGIYASCNVGECKIKKGHSVDFLKQLPPLIKADIRSIHNQKNHSGNYVEQRSTSGSTGEPLTFYKGKLSTGAMDAVMYRANAWHGIDMGDPQARFWGLPFDKKARISAHIKDIVKNRKRFSAFSLVAKSKRAFYKKLIKFKPTHFYGYPSLIYEFALYMRQEKLSLPRPPKVIIGTGEYADPMHVEFIQKVFKSRFINEYGCTEVGVIGFECVNGHMHLMAQNIYMEVLKNDVPVFDQEGEICVTELYSDYLPFIRYKTGDRGTILSKPCSCGIVFPRIEISKGRIDDYIFTPEGERVYDAILAYTLKNGVARFKAYQKALDELEIYIEPVDKISEGQLNEFRLRLKKAISPNMNIVFHIVDQVPRERSGKLRYFTSMIK